MSGTRKSTGRNLVKGYQGWRRRRPVMRTMLNESGVSFRGEEMFWNENAAVVA